MRTDDGRFYGRDNGGGFGDPLEREPEAVLNDVQSEVVSMECARDLYGVVLKDDAEHVDQEATRQLRARMKAKRLEKQE